MRFLTVNSPLNDVEGLLVTQVHENEMSFDATVRHLSRLAVRAASAVSLEAQSSLLMVNHFV